MKNYPRQHTVVWSPTNDSPMPMPNKSSKEIIDFCKQNGMMITTTQILENYHPLKRLGMIHFDKESHQHLFLLRYNYWYRKAVDNDFLLIPDYEY